MAETRNKSIVKAISNALVLGEIDTTGNIAGGDLDADTTPQLGGNLDINGNDIISLAGANIDILPHTSGKVNLDGDGSTSGVSVTDGLIEMRTSTGSVASIDMYCEVSNAHKVTIKPPPHADYSGNVTFQLPSSNGTSGYVLQTDGNGVTSWAAAAGGLTGFTAADNTSSPNNTINAASITVDSSSTDADFVIEPKGAGAILSHIPGGDAATGNKRGKYAIDLQLNRTDGTPDAGDVPSIYMGTIISGYGNSMGVTGSATTGSTSSTVYNTAIISARDSSITSDNTGGQVHDAVIIGGYGNTISNNGTSDSYQAAILGGSGNTLTGWRSAIIGGYSHSISNWYNSIVAGYDNTISGQYGGILSGRNNVIDSTSNYSVMVGGQNSETEGDYSIISGGYSHFIDDPAQYSAIIAGYNNEVDNDYSVIVGGRDNVMTDSSADHSAIIGGRYNSVTSSGSVAVGGQSNVIDAPLSVAVGGADNSLNGYSCVTLGGFHGDDAGKWGVVIMPAVNSSSSWDDGEAQHKYATVCIETTDATPLALTSNATTQIYQYNVPSYVRINGAMYFKISVIATVTGGGDTKSWTFEGVAKKGATNSTLAFVGTPAKNVIASDTGASAWDVDLSLNTSQGVIQVDCTGAASTTIRWVAQYSMTDVGF